MNSLTLLGTALAFVAVTILCALMLWSTVRSMWQTHGSIATLRKRQLVQAQRDELLYAQAAEYYGALREAARATMARLETP